MGIYYGAYNPTLDGSSSSKAAISAMAIKAVNPSAYDGVYWINLPTAGPTQIYCIMDPTYDGGGWMMMMKATTGTTFNYSANYWTTANTLNPTATNQNDGDAKFNTMNYFEARDIMARWPSLSSASYGGGSIPDADCWTWLQNEFYAGTRITPISFFSTAGTYNNGGNATTGDYGGYFIGDAKSYSGWNPSIFSNQPDIRFYGFNFKNYPGFGFSGNVRWGFGWNENGEGLYTGPSSLASGGAPGSDDVSGGIGMDSSFGSYSAGDYFNCCGNEGINSSLRVELYVR